MFKNSALLIALFLTISLINLEATRMYPRPITKSNNCSLTVRCNPYYSDKLIWTLADGICRVYQNGCIYGLAKCQRQNDFLPPMTDSNKEECYNYCASCCDDQPEETVCGWFPLLSSNATAGEEQREFRNQCKLDQWSCRNGRPYGSVNQGSCPEKEK